MDIDRELFIDTLEAAELDEDVLHTDYSGRGMYGATCAALYLDNSADLYVFIAAISAQLDPDVAVALARDVRTDQLGLGIVAYWPELTLPDVTEVTPDSRRPSLKLV